MNNFEVGIIGGGVAGVFAAYKNAKDYPKVKTILIEAGAGPQKRRQQLWGFLGSLPSGDGKLFLPDAKSISDIVGAPKGKSALKEVRNILENVMDFKVIKDRGPSISMTKKLNKAGYETELNSYVQMLPVHVHELSRFISSETNSLTCRFNTEVTKIIKQKDGFIVQTEENQEYRCNNIILALGRSGWRQSNSIFSDFNLIKENDLARFGVRIEMPGCNLKEFSKSTSSLKKGNIEIGPFSWGGTVIPEDHFDMAISAFRSNEARWETEKVSFNFIGNVLFPGKGFEQTDRLGQLTFILTNERISKEKIGSFLNGRSKISPLKEYDFLKKELTNFAQIVPNVLKASFHVPTIIPMTAKINVNKNMETDIPGLFVAGEAAGKIGILAAAMSGILCVEGIK